MSDFIDALRNPAHPYRSLALVLQDAFDQAASGKGRERHGREADFERQPMQTISDLLQTADGLHFQAIKKIVESRGMDLDAERRELLGAIVYTAGILVSRSRLDYPPLRRFHPSGTGEAITEYADPEGDHRILSSKINLRPGTLMEKKIGPWGEYVILPDGVTKASWFRTESGKEFVAAKGWLL